jgi:hypothetical protein
MSPLRVISDNDISLSGKSVSANGSVAIKTTPTIQGYSYRGTIIKDGTGLNGVNALIVNNSTMYLTSSIAQTFGSTAKISVTHFFEAD